MTEFDLQESNPLDDKRVLLSLTIADIVSECEQIGVDHNSLDIDEVFRLHRKFIENTAMDIYWNTLDDAIRESVRDKT